MSELNHNLRTQKPADPDRPVLVHGDPERAHMQKCDQQGGIEYHINQIKMAVCIKLVYFKNFLITKLFT